MPRDVFALLDGIIVETNIIKSLNEVKGLNLNINEEEEGIVLEYTMFFAKFNGRAKETIIKLKEPLMLANDKK
jgi:hypothetical protein